MHLIDQKTCFYNCMETWKNSRIIRHRIRHLERLGNLHFDKEGYLHVFVFYGLFHKINRKHPPPMFPGVIESLSTGRLCKTGESLYVIISLIKPKHICQVDFVGVLDILYNIDMKSRLCNV